MLCAARKEIKELKIQNAILSVNQKKRGRKVPNTGIDGGPEFSQEDLTKMLGRRYQMVVAPWIDVQILSDPIPSGQPYGVTRYTSPASKRDGLLSEIYKLVPPHLHSHMRENAKFATLVCDTVSTFSRLMPDLAVPRGL
jgi:hypothetical protein